MRREPLRSGLPAESDAVVFRVFGSDALMRGKHQTYAGASGNRPPLTRPAAAMPVRGLMMPPENQNDSGQQAGQEGQNANTNAQKGQEKGGNEFKAITSQEDFDSAIKDRLDRQKNSHKDEIDALQKQLNDLKSDKGNEKKDDKSDDSKKSPLEKQIEEMQKQFDEIQAEKQAASDREARLEAVKAEKLDPQWADLIGGKDASEWKANATKVRELISKQKSAPDTNTGHQSKPPSGGRSNGAPEYKFRPRGKTVQVT